MHRRADRPQRPLPFRRVGDGKGRYAATRVVPRDDPIVRPVPVIAARRVRDGARRRGLRRPGAVDHDDRLQLNTVRLRPHSPTGNLKSDRRMSVRCREREAAIVEALAGERRGSATFVCVERWGHARHRVAHRLERSPSVRDRAFTDRAEYVADRGRLSRTQVDDAAPGRTPRLSAARARIDAIFI